MTIGRREFLRRGAFFGGGMLAPQVFLRPLRASSSAAPRNLVVVEMIGGNDGFNTMVPFGLNSGAYYSLYRPTLGVSEGSLLKVPGSPVAFHPAWAGLKGEFNAGRLAVVQGVSYPQPAFSHLQSQRIWRSGDPSGLSGEGWLGRYLATHPEPGFPCAAELFSNTTQLSAGAPGVVPAFHDVDDFTFPFDPLHPEEAALRRYFFSRIAADAETADGTASSIGGSSTGVMQLVDSFATVGPATPGGYPNHPFADAMKTAAHLLASPLGLRFFHVGLAGFDTHDDQNHLNFHPKLLGQVSATLAAFQSDLIVKGIDSETVVLLFTEFGRTVQENASGGTDHGTITPAWILGTRVNGGFVNEHPSLHPSQLDEHGEPSASVDFRDVVGTLLTRWLGESPATATEILHGYEPHDLGFIL